MVRIPAIRRGRDIVKAVRRSRGPYARPTVVRAALSRDTVRARRAVAACRFLQHWCFSNRLESKPLRAPYRDEPEAPSTRGHGMPSDDSSRAIDGRAAERARCIEKYRRERLRIKMRLRETRAASNVASHVSVTRHVEAMLGQSSKSR